ncbi:ATP-binding protein [Streptomyces polyrhachis]|uniref:ATP-binding protein n=1 Tax=Streptomyces polyrhachis TaxID=1282885 RepID=A0ABW2GLY9_9ACTN
MTAIAPPGSQTGPASPRADVWADTSEYAACTLEAQPWSPRVARSFTRTTLRAWGLAPLSADVELVVHEFVVNALSHGMGQVWSEPAPHPVILGLFRDGDALLCAAFDPGVRQPRPLRSAVGAQPGPYGSGARRAGTPDAHAPLADSGRGLQLVAAVSRCWGWTVPGPEGKAVWAAFATTPPSPALAARLLAVAEIFTGRERPRLITAPPLAA